MAVEAGSIIKAIEAPVADAVVGAAVKAATRQSMEISSAESQLDELCPPEDKHVSKSPGG